MLCWLRCGLSCCWRGDLLRHSNDGCLRVRNRPRRVCRLSGARCTRDRGLVVVFCPFLDRTRVLLTHHQEERVGFQLGFDDTQAELKLRPTLVTAHELVYMESIEGQQSFRRRTDRGGGRPEVDDEGTLTGSSRRFPRRSQ